MKKEVWFLVVLLLGCEVAPVQPQKKGDSPPAPERPLPPSSLPFFLTPPSPPALPPAPEPPPADGFGLECHQLFQMVDAMCVDASIPVTVRGELCRAMQQSLDAIKHSPPSQLESSCKQVREALQPSLASLRSTSFPAVP